MGNKLQKIVTFEDHNLNVDYVTFNWRNGKDRINEIANIFNVNYSFDSYLVNQRYEKPAKEAFLVTNKSHQLIFVINCNEYKPRTVLIQFPGKNGAHLYNLLKSGEFYWSDFDDFNLVLARFDINFIREQQVIDDLVFHDFARRSIKKYNARYPQAEIDPPLTTSPGFGLGTRSGDYFLRIYKRNENSSLEFELEIKKLRARNYHHYLLDLNQTFSEFENLIATRFYQYLKIALVLDTELTDWLLIILRKTEKPLRSLVSNLISTTYRVEETSIIEQKKFYRILQFLSFSRRFSYNEEIFQGETFQSFSFPLVEFAKDIGLKNNFYNRQNLVQFFHSLSTLSLDQWFSEEEFKSVAAFPIITVTREQPGNERTKLIVKVSILNNLFLKYPFSFPKTFLMCNNADDVRVKLQFIVSVAREVTIRKQFCLSDFLSTISSISNQRKAAIKKNIIKQFQILEKEGFVQSKITLHQKDDKCQSVTIQELTLSQISKTKVIDFWETDKYFIDQLMYY